MELISWTWLAICLISMIVEFANESTLVSVWFAFGAFIAFMLSLLGINEVVQVVVFLLSSFLLLILLRPYFNKRNKERIEKTNADSLIGKNTKLLKDITYDEYGEVKFDGVIWNATTIDKSNISKETIVKVIDIRGSKLIVELTNEKGGE